MRIAVVGPTHPIKGGISHYTTLLVRALRNEHEVLFISYAYQYPEIIYPGKGQTADDKNPIIEETEFLWHTLKPWTLTKIAERMKEFGVECVVLTWVTHFFGWHIATLAKKIKKLVGCPVILLCHNVKQHEDRPLETPLTRMAYEAVDGFIVHSEEDKTNLLKFIPDAKVAKNFHPTYDIFASVAEWNRVEARKALQISEETPMVLYFGAVRPYKGLIWLVKAAPEIIKKVPGCQIWCVGDYWDGPSEFEKTARERGALYDDSNPDKGGVRIVDGYIPNEEVGKYFAAADLVVLPYESATQSGIVQIAYGFDKPCIVTDVGGLPEVVLNEKTGYVVPPKNSDEITRKTVKYFSLDKAGKTQFVEGIREWRKVFDWEHMVHTIEGLKRSIETGN